MTAEELTINVFDSNRNAEGEKAIEMTVSSSVYKRRFKEWAVFTSIQLD
jgi:hypothetical protein